MTVRPKQKITETALLWGEFTGAAVLVDLRPNQTLQVRRDGRYYIANRGCLKIRLTEAALWRNFEEVEEVLSDALH